MRLLVRFAVGVFCLLLPDAVDARQPTTRPNVVLIITDDAGAGDFGVYGAPDIATPAIDRLARQGVRFTDFYANGPTCSPTRVGLITGRYQQRYAIEGPLRNADTAGDEGLRPNGRSLPALVRSNGYVTGLVGKWHLGYTAALSPAAHGFDYFFGNLSGYIDYYTHTGGAGEADLWENGVPVKADGYMTDLITDRSIRFLEDHVSRPFFLEVAYTAPHWPYQRPNTPSVAPDHARHVGPMEEGTSTRADYVTLVEHMDAGVGKILAALDRLRLSNDTIVIFTNDNGGEWLSRNAPFFNRKGSVWEGGIRVPAIVRWPNRIPAGKVTSQVGVTMDLTVTILNATGTPIPADARLEGTDLMPVLRGRVPETARTLFWRTQQQRAVRSGNWKLLADGNTFRLFDLKTDPSERFDLIGPRSEVARRLRPLIEQWEADVNEEAARTSPGRGAAPAGAGRGGRPGGGGAQGGRPGGPGTN